VRVVIETYFDLMARAQLNDVPACNSPPTNTTNDYPDTRHCEHSMLVDIVFPHDIYLLLLHCPQAIVKQSPSTGKIQLVALEYTICTCKEQWAFGLMPCRRRAGVGQLGFGVAAAIFTRSNLRAHIALKPSRRTSQSANPPTG